MKKLILSAAMLAVCASCAKNEFEEIGKPATAIGFSALNSRATKVANENADATNSNYTVYAAISGTTDAWFMADEKVTVATGATTETADDATTNDYYWPTDAQTLSFFAFAPDASDDNVTSAATAATGLTATYVVDADAAEDFTVATPITGATYADPNGAATGTVTAGKVPLSFNHMLSKATMKVTLTDGTSTPTGYTCTFTSIDFTAKNNQVVANVYAGTTTSVDVSGTDLTYNYVIARSTTAATAFTGTQELFFAPHDATATTNVTADGCTIVINGLKVMNASDLVIYNKDMTFTLDNTVTFEAGKQYLFDIAVNVFTNKITFSSTPVAWTPATPASTPIK